MTPVVLADSTFQPRAFGLQALARGGQAQSVELARGDEFRVAEGGVGHVEVLRMGSVRTSIIERPRPLPRERRSPAATAQLNLFKPSGFRRRTAQIVTDALSTFTSPRLVEDPCLCSVTILEESRAPGIERSHQSLAR